MNLLIITTTHNQETLDANLKRSDLFRLHPHSLTPDFKNVSKSYNVGMGMNVNSYDAFIFSHEDVFIPDTFEGQLKQALKELEGVNWGVLGVAGVRYGKIGLSGFGRTMHGHINDRGREWGRSFDKPMSVQTLDELLLIVNPKSNLMFDEQFDLDFYGADICMQAHQKGLGVYVIPGYVHHNSSRKFGGRTSSFYENESRFRKKWFNYLPIATTCTIIKN